MHSPPLFIYPRRVINDVQELLKFVFGQGFRIYSNGARLEDEAVSSTTRHPFLKHALCLVNVSKVEGTFAHLA